MYKVVFLLLCLFACVSPSVAQEQTSFIQTRSTKFYVGDTETPYRYLGFNMWYAPLLGSKGQEGNRQRLVSELDTLQAHGVLHLRILAGVKISKDGQSWETCVKDENTLKGLDFALSEMQKRGMRAVVCLTDTLPTDEQGRKRMIEYISQLLRRTNHITRQPYVASPTIMSWQIAEHIRPQNVKEADAVADFILQTAETIKQADGNHLVSAGCFELNTDKAYREVCERIMNDEQTDYFAWSIFPFEQKMISRGNIISGLSSACVQTDELLTYAERMAYRADKPFVVDAVGYPREGCSAVRGSYAQSRLSYFAHLFFRFAENKQVNDTLQGCTLWSWGGTAMPGEDGEWNDKQTYTGDLPNQTQGFYSVFADDYEVLQLVQEAMKQ